MSMSSRVILSLENDFCRCRSYLILAVGCVEDDDGEAHSQIIERHSKSERTKECLKINLTEEFE